MGNVEATPFAVSPELGDALAKVAVFTLVQALVYLILRKSSDVFAPGRTARSLSFRPMRSMSVHRVLAAFSDVPVGVPVDGGAGAPAPPPLDNPGADDKRASWLK